MSRRRTRLPPHFGRARTGAAAAPAFDVPANLGTTPGPVPKVDQVLRERPGLVLRTAETPRADWRAIAAFAGGLGLLALAFGLKR